MQAVSLDATRRTSTGKGAARSLRREGKTPAVLYGHDQPAVSLVIDQREVGRLLDLIGGETVLINVAIDGDAPVQAIVREVQRNPVRRSDVIHLDLYAIVAGEPIIVEIPVHLKGNPEGVRNQGGIIDQHLHRLTIKCLPSQIPENVEIDINHLHIGDAIHVSDLTVPEAEIMNDPDVSIVGVMAARVEIAPEPVAEDLEAPEVIAKGKEDEAEAGTEAEAEG